MRPSTSSFVRTGTTKTLLGAIATYRAVVSPWLPARCRFVPSCSAYAAEAIASHGPLTGMCLAAARIGRCHPWHSGGYDPVPADVRRAAATVVGSTPAIDTAD